MNISSVGFKVTRSSGKVAAYVLKRPLLVPSNELYLHQIVGGVDTVLGFYKVTNETATARLVKSAAMDTSEGISDYQNMIALLTQG